MSDQVNFYIVVADDDPEDHALVKNALSECNLNHIMSSVYNGSQLMNLLNKKGFYKTESLKKPDMIILDLRMPIMSGLEALKKIKSDLNFKDIPVYVLSDMADKNIYNEARELGAADCFKKPLDFEELKNLVQTMCKSATT
jgi:two-component system, response regulator